MFVASMKTYSTVCITSSEFICHFRVINFDWDDRIETPINFDDVVETSRACSGQIRS